MTRPFEDTSDYSKWVGTGTKEGRFCAAYFGHLEKYPGQIRANQIRFYVGEI